jgi:hypothetical protein
MQRGQTQVNYGNVSIFNCLIRDFRQEAVLEPSGTDLRYHRFSISVVGFVTANFDALDPLKRTVGVEPPNDIPNYNKQANSAALAQKTVRHRLQEMRQHFQFITGADQFGDGGQLLLDVVAYDVQGNPGGIANGQGQSFDLCNGPSPKLFSITNIAGDQLFRVEWAIEACVLECGFTSGGFNGVLSNRWNVTDDIDRQFMTTRTFSGELRLACPVNNPNAFREWVVPSIQPGMARDRMVFQVAEDALTLRYTITDKEVVYSAPPYCTSWSMNHTESAGANALLGAAQIEVVLTAPRDVPRQYLMAQVISIIENKILCPLSTPKAQANNKDNDLRIAEIQRNNLLEEYSLTDSILPDGGSIIRGACRIKRNAAQGMFGPIFTFQLGVPLDAKSQDPNDPNAGYEQSPAAEFFDPIAQKKQKYNSNYSYDGYLDKNGNLEPPLVNGSIAWVTAFACYLQTPCDNNHRMSDYYAPDTDRVISNPRPYSTGDQTYGTGVQIRGDYKLDNQPDDLLSKDQFEAAYTHYRVDSHFDLETGFVQLPLAAPPQQSDYAFYGGPQDQGQGPGAQYYNGQGSQSAQPTCVIANLFGPLYSRIVRIEAERAGQEPKLPSIADIQTTPQQILIRHTMIPQSYDSTPDGKPIYRINAEYEFAINGIPNLSDTPGLGLPIGPIPWLNPSATPSGSNFQTWGQKSLTGGNA